MGLNYYKPFPSIRLLAVLEIFDFLIYYNKHYRAHLIPNNCFKFAIRSRLPCTMHSRYPQPSRENSLSDPLCEGKPLLTRCRTVQNTNTHNPPNITIKCCVGSRKWPSDPLLIHSKPDPVTAELQCKVGHTRRATECCARLYAVERRTQPFLGLV